MIANFTIRTLSPPKIKAKKADFDNGFFARFCFVLPVIKLNRFIEESCHLNAVGYPAIVLFLLTLILLNFPSAKLTFTLKNLPYFVIQFSTKTLLYKEERLTLISRAAAQVLASISPSLRVSVYITLKASFITKLGP